MTRCLALVGFMAAGKTTVGSIVARRAKVPFYDSDDEIAAVTGRTASEWIREAGEPAWRREEECWLRSTLTKGSAVLALGGGAFTQYRIRRLLAGSAATVWLDPAFEQLKKRLGEVENRPLWPDLPEERQRLYARRNAVYRLAGWRLRLDAEVPEAVADRVFEIWDPSGC